MIGMLPIYAIIHWLFSLTIVPAALTGGKIATRTQEREDACSQVELRSIEMSACMYQCDPSFEADVMEFDKCIPYMGQWTDECRLIIKKKALVAPCFCGCVEEHEPDYVKVKKCSGSKQAEKKRWDFCEMGCMCRGRNEKRGIDGGWPAIEACPGFCDAEAERRKRSRDEL